MDPDEKEFVSVELDSVHSRSRERLSESFLSFSVDSNCCSIFGTVSMSTGKAGGGGSVSGKGGGGGGACISSAMMLSDMFGESLGLKLDTNELHCHQIMLQKFTVDFQRQVSQRQPLVLFSPHR